MASLPLWLKATLPFRTAVVHWCKRWQISPFCCSPADSFFFVSSRSLPHLSVSTPSGSVAPSWLPCPPSSRCGSQNRNTMKLAHPLSTVNASKHVYMKKDHYYLVTTLRMTTLWTAGCWTPAVATLPFYFVTMSLLLLLQMPCDTECM